MKRFTLFTFTFFAVFVQAYLAYGQPTISSVDDPTTRTSTFQTQNLLSGSHTFYIFGDGHFSMQNHPVHQYRKDGSFDVILYAVDPYTVTPPAIHDDTGSVTYSNTNVPQGSLTSSFTMNGKIVSVGQSWNAADNYRLVLMVSFTHPDPSPNALPIDGNVELYLDRDLNYSQIHYTNGDWATCLGDSPTGIPAIPNKITWNYTQLQPGEIRHVYAEVDVLPGTSRKIKAIAEMTPDYYDCGLEDCTYTDINRMPRTDKPKDPNTMVAYPACVKASSPNRQTLDYGVYFYNEGTGYAKNVVLDIEINSNMSLNDIKISNSSDPCIFDIDPASGNLVITFPNIYLPGVKQTYPYSYHFNETTAFVEFSVCSEPYLASGSYIEGVTDIYFDNEPPVRTNWVQTFAENPCPLAVPCGLERDPEKETKDRQKFSLNQSAFTGSSLQLSPNPFSDQLEITYIVNQPEGEMVSISLSNISGVQIRQLLPRQYQPFGKQQEQFDLTDLPAGVYLLSIQQADQIKTRKLVKL